MAWTRRQFLNSSLGATAGALAIPHIRPLAAEARPLVAVPSPSKSLRLLFLGGTGFIGPHMVRYAMYRGHQVTLFNRGRSNADLFPGAELLTGDRDGNLESLKGKKWDAVIDNSGYVPRHVIDSAKLLDQAVGRYLFISTGSVYAPDQDALPETAKLLELTEPGSEDVNKHYGALKVLCENAVMDRFKSRGTVLRLHIVAGPGDPTNRFTYWPVRINAGGDIVAPGPQSAPVQFIDVRDLAEFTIHSVERNNAGIYNTAGPTLDPTTMAEFLYGIRATTQARTSFTWIDEPFLTEQKARYQLVVPPASPARGIMNVRSHKAVAAGLTFRPLAVTAVDTLEWFQSLPQAERDKLPLNLERDAKVIAAWKARGSK